MAVAFVHCLGLEHHMDRVVRPVPTTFEIAILDSLGPMPGEPPILIRNAFPFEPQSGVRFMHNCAFILTGHDIEKGINSAGAAPKKIEV